MMVTLLDSLFLQLGLGIRSSLSVPLLSDTIFDAKFLEKIPSPEKCVSPNTFSTTAPKQLRLEAKFGYNKYRI
jgi:hypothetical protein